MFFVLVPLALVIGCGDCSSEDTESRSDDPQPETPQTPPAANPPSMEQTSEAAASFERGLILSYAPFVVENGAATTTPDQARFDLLTRADGRWTTQSVRDGDSNVFHKALAYGDGILTAGGTGAAIKLWTRNGVEWSSETIWAEEFGGEQNRMRDIELADIDGDGSEDIIVGTHDQGIIAVIHRRNDGYEVQRLDSRPNIWVHEVETGDLNGDGKIEIYATPSEPNTLEGGEQHGEVVRYVPAADEGRTVVADLGNRHAKEILVADVDGDGRDELYVSVEALTERVQGEIRIVEGVEIRRYDHDTGPTEGVVIATLNDRFCRFLTAGDVDGDGKKELVAAPLRSGLWLLRPGSDPRGEWAVESIARDSSGFEHSALLADLDGDGSDELYVASDDQRQIRSYVWRNGRGRAETLVSWEVERSLLTFNITAAPASLLSP